MKEKKIFQEAKYGNTVFVGHDRDGTPKCCSMRANSPYKSFKMDAENSCRSFPFFHEGKSGLVIVGESPIDMMSHATPTELHRGDWRQDHRIFLGCLWDGALERYLSWRPEIKRIVFAYDNDYLVCDKDCILTNWGQATAKSTLRNMLKRIFLRHPHAAIKGFQFGTDRIAQRSDRLGNGHTAYGRIGS